MRVTLACLLVAVGLGLAAVPAAAQPAVRIEVEPIIAALDGGERIVRSSGSVARFDEARVRRELGSEVRVVVLPYVDYELYEDANGESLFYDLVRGPILEWAGDRDVRVVLVSGLDVSLLNWSASLDDRLPADLDELRITASTHDVTERLLVVSRLGRGVPSDVAAWVEVLHPAPVPASPQLVAEVVATLQEGRIHNAPGRAEPIEAGVLERAEEFGLTDDVAQEVCVIVLGALSRYRDKPEKFLTFVYGVAAHKVADHRRRSAVRDLPSNGPDDASGDDVSQDVAAQPAAEPAASDLAARLNDLLDVPPCPA
jgi:hypothetical protein